MHGGWICNRQQPAGTVTNNYTQQIITQQYVPTPPSPRPDTHRGFIGCRGHRLPGGLRLRWGQRWVIRASGAASTTGSEEEESGALGLQWFGLRIFLIFTSLIHGPLLTRYGFRIQCGQLLYTIKVELLEASPDLRGPQRRY